MSRQGRGRSPRQRTENPDSYAQGTETPRFSEKRRFTITKVNLAMRAILSIWIFGLFGCLLGYIVIVRFDDSLLRSVGSLFALPMGMVLGYWFGVWTQHS